MPQQTAREAAHRALGEPVDVWITGLRNSSARLTYNQIARVLREEHGVDVTAETVRTWQATPLPVEAPPAANGGDGRAA